MTTEKGKLSQFKYTGGSDTGVNEAKQKILYNIVFPADKAVEVPDDVAHKLRTKAGNPGDEFVEVVVGAGRTETELQAEAAAKEQAKTDKRPDKPLTKEELTELRGKAAAEDARVAKVQADAKAGR